MRAVLAFTQSDIATTIYRIASSTRLPPGRHCSFWMTQYPAETLYFDPGIDDFAFKHHTIWKNLPNPLPCIFERLSEFPWSLMARQWRLVLRQLVLVHLDAPFPERSFRAGMYPERRRLISESYQPENNRLFSYCLGLGSYCNPIFNWVYHHIPRLGLISILRHPFSLRLPTSTSMPHVDCQPVPCVFSLDVEAYEWHCANVTEVATNSERCLFGHLVRFGSLTVGFVT
jgi:hypothetical protein